MGPSPPVNTGTLGRRDGGEDSQAVTSPTLPTRSIHTIAWSATAFVALGCRGGRDDPSGRFVPEPAAARRAVATMLDEWRDGKDEASGATISVVDKGRKPGRRPVRAEILGEVGAESGRGFAVRLTFENPDEQVVDRYLVIGTGPIWVFRQADYEMISHWMHPMDPKDAPAEPEAARKP